MVDTAPDVEVDTGEQVDFGQDHEVGGGDDLEDVRFEHSIDAIADRPLRDLELTGNRAVRHAAIFVEQADNGTVGGIGYRRCTVRLNPFPLGRRVAVAAA